MQTGRSTKQKGVLKSPKLRGKISREMESEDFIVNITEICPSDIC